MAKASQQKTRRSHSSKLPGQDRFSERFVSMGLIDPMDNNNAQTAVYWMQERQVQGFRFHPQYYNDVDILKRSQSDLIILILVLKK